MNKIDKYINKRIRRGGADRMTKAIKEFADKLSNKPVRKITEEEMRKYARLEDIL